MKLFSNYCNVDENLFIYGLFVSINVFQFNVRILLCVHVCCPDH